MRITGRSVTNKEREVLIKMADDRGADEVTIGFMTFNTCWKMVARFIKDGRVIDWITL